MMDGWMMLMGLRKIKKDFGFAGGCEEFDRTYFVIFDQLIFFYRRRRREKKALFDYCLVVSMIRVGR